MRLHNKVDLRLPLLNLLAHPIHLRQLRHIRLEEFNLPILIDGFAFLDDSFCGGGRSANDVDLRGDGVLHECFEGKFADAAGSTDYATLVHAPVQK